jgi:hypothetical protein
LGGRIPQRHIDVELIKSEVVEAHSPDDLDDEPSSGSRTVAIAVVAGIAIGMAVSAAVILALR